jgi:hypothetical protein
MARTARRAALVAIWLVGSGGARAECGPVEDAERASHRALTLADFARGVPRGEERSARGEETAILITTALRVDALALRSEQAGGEFVASVRERCVRAVLVKERTGRKRAARAVWDAQPESSDSDLRHEQGHFDLTQSCARRLDAELSRLTQRAASVGAAERGLRERAARLYRDASAECQALQDRYDRETRHGHKSQAQAHWSARIAAELAHGADTASELAAH